MKIKSLVTLTALRLWIISLTPVIMAMSLLALAAVRLTKFALARFRLP